MTASASLHRTVPIDGSPAPVRALRAMVASFLRDRAIDEAATRAVVLAFGEALDNAVEHGLLEKRGQVQVKLRYTPRFILVSLQDTGSDKAPLGLAHRASDDAERGRGFELMHKLMHHVKVRTFPAGGTRVTLFRRLDEPT